MALFYTAQLLFSIYRKIDGKYFMLCGFLLQQFFKSSRIIGTSDKVKKLK